MNRFLKFSFASFAILFVLAFISCKSNDEDDDSPAPKNKLSVTATEASTAELGGSYSKDITVAVDFAENAVLSSRVALSTTSENLANGDDIKDLLKANIVNANGVSSADSFSISSAIIKSLSAQSITFSVAGTAPSENSSVTLTLLLPPKFMKDGLPFGKPVQKVSVGTGVTASNTAAEVSIPKKTDLAGKILKTKDGDESSYYVFDKNSNITRYYSGHHKEWESRTLSYDETKGEIVSTSEDKTSAVEKIISANGTYYTVDWDEIPRTEGSGLEGVFHVFDEDEEEGVPVSTETTITLNGDETLSYYKIEIDRTGKDEERHTEKRYLIGGGAYINKNGILSISGTWFYFSKNADTDEELKNEIMPAATLELIYDGSTLYLTGGSCSFAEESELPESISD